MPSVCQAHTTPMDSDVLISKASFIKIFVSKICCCNFLMNEKHLKVTKIINGLQQNLFIFYFCRRGTRLVCFKSFTVSWKIAKCNTFYWYYNHTVLPPVSALQDILPLMQFRAVICSEASKLRNVMLWVHWNTWKERKIPVQKIRRNKQLYMAIWCYFKFHKIFSQEKSILMKPGC